MSECFIDNLYAWYWFPVLLLKQTCGSLGAEAVCYGLCFPRGSSALLLAELLPSPSKVPASSHILKWNSFCQYLFFSPLVRNKSVLPLRAVIFAARVGVFEQPGLPARSAMQDNCAAVPETTRGRRSDASWKEEPFVPSASLISQLDFLKGFLLAGSLRGGKSEGSALVIEFVNNEAGSNGSVLWAGWKNHPDHVPCPAGRMPLQGRWTEPRCSAFLLSPCFMRGGIWFHWINLRAISWKLDCLWNEM